MLTRWGSRALATSAAALAMAAAVAMPARGAEPEWNIARVGGPASAPGVVVAVVDTGVDATHPALAGRVLPTVDLIGGGAGDPNGHGTHVAGTVAGADAGCGTIGVVPDARILPVRALDAAGGGTVGTVVDGIRKAADAGAAVINLSLGTDVLLRRSSGDGLLDALQYAWDKGAVPVLAAGNGGLLGGIFGSGYGDVPALVVTATDNRDRVAPYATSIGSAAWGIAAPGGDGSGQTGRDVLSAFPDRRCALNAGTSMAAPHVSGALAALRAAGLSPRAAVDRILATAADLGPRGFDGTFGHGLLDLRAATAGAEPARPSVPTSTDAPSPAPTPPSAPGPIPAAPARRRPPASTATTRAEDAVPPEGPGAVPGAAERGGEQSTTTTRPPPPSEDPGPSAAAPEAPPDDGRPPAGAVLVAAAAVALAGAGSAVAIRRLRR